MSYYATGKFKEAQGIKLNILTQQQEAFVDRRSKTGRSVTQCAVIYAGLGKYKEAKGVGCVSTDISKGISCLKAC